MAPWSWASNMDNESGNLGKLDPSFYTLKYLKSNMLSYYVADVLQMGEDIVIASLTSSTWPYLCKLVKLDRIRRSQPTFSKGIITATSSFCGYEQHPSRLRCHYFLLMCSLLLIPMYEVSRLFPHIVLRNICIPRNKEQLFHESVLSSLMRHTA